MSSANAYSATEASAALASGKLTALSLAEDCLARIRAREPDVQAWEHLDAEQVLNQAKARDQEPRRSMLHGIPVGIKDIIDTVDMPTCYGSSIYAGHRPRADAACVAILREAGAVIMGKTVTVELAAFHWARTRNPRNLEHSPGGSSSGSAAAVADCMIPTAVGTQTGGSTIRPASFCGIVGYKPSFNLVNRAGVKPLAESQDTVGLFARSVPDVAMMVSVLSGCAAPEFEQESARPPRIALCRMTDWPGMGPAMAKAMEEGAATLARKGARVTTLVLPQAFEVALVEQRKMNDYEAWRALTFEHSQHGQQLSATLSGKLSRAALVTYDEYAAAQDAIARCRLLLTGIFADYDVLLAPSAWGEAPVGIRNTTADSDFASRTDRIWTAFHTPTLNLPVFRGETGLPMGLQVIGPYREDRRTLSYAEWIYRALTA